MERVVTLLTTPLPAYGYTLIGIGFVTLFTVRGCVRGFLKELSSILSLTSSIVLAKPLGFLLKGLLPLEKIPLVFHGIAALTIGGILGYVLIRILFSLIVRSCNLNREWKGRALILIRLGGALIGGLFGILMIFILSWYVLLVGKLTLPPEVPEETGGAKPEVSEETGGTKIDLLQLPAKIMSTHREGLAESALGEIAEKTNPAPAEIVDSIDLISELTRNPEKMQQVMQSEQMTQMMQLPSVQNVIENQELQSLAEQGDFMGLLNHPAITEVLDDPAVQEALQSIDPSELMEMLGK